MLVEKVINNNIVRTHDENDNEILVMGSGLGFKKNPGDPIATEKIEKRYFLKQDDNSLNLEALLAEIPLTTLQAANAIVELGEQAFGQSLPANFNITLADHIHFALERQQQGLQIKNNLSWEIKRFYRQEYQIGLQALTIIKNLTQAQLPEDEAAFIAFHFISVTLNDDSHLEAQEIIDVIKDITNIIKFQFGMELDEGSLYYERFITHLKFSLYRIFHQEQPADIMAAEIFEILTIKYPKQYQTVLKINDYFQKKYQLQLSQDEISYLTIHLARITLNN